MNDDEMATRIRKLFEDGDRREGPGYVLDRRQAIRYTHDADIVT